MRIHSALLGLCLLAAFVSAPVVAGADDEKWIAKCVADNKNEGAKKDVVRKYCTCMNNKMDDNETASITAWEKKNPKAMAACEKEAGWK